MEYYAECKFEVYQVGIFQKQLEQNFLHNIYFDTTSLADEISYRNMKLNQGL